MSKRKLTFVEPFVQFKAELIENANKIASSGKGILAADESVGTIGKRFAPINVENNEANRNLWREILCESDMENYISGVIFFEEQLKAKTADGKKRIVDLIEAKGILPGIKIDKGVKPIEGTAGETATQGITDLGARCKEYYALGARFSKWRNVLKIDPATGLPSDLAIQDAAFTLARQASISQSEGLVPIVEPEILVLDGSHSIDDAAYVQERVLAAVFKALRDHHVLLEGCLLKPNMTLAGKEAKDQPSAAEVGMFTVRTLSRTVPPALPGIMFLSGGMSEEEAAVHLSAVNQQPKSKAWHLSFSYGRALQASALKAWQGKPENREAAKKTFLEQAKKCSEAQLGKYQGTGEKGESLYIKNYVY